MPETNLSDNYRYQYRLTLRFGNWEHNYELMGQHGGVRLHITKYGEMYKDTCGPYGGGIEFHYRTPGKGDSKPPDHDQCWLIKCPCWHDGSSLWASEYWIPMFANGGKTDHVRMFRALAQAADRKFAEHLGQDEEG